MKLRRFKKRWIEAGLVFVMTAGLAGRVWQGMAISEEGGLLTKAQVKEDRNQAIQYVEDVHPFFVTDQDQSEYRIAKEKYIEETQKSMSVSELRMSTSEYLSSLHDAHTVVSWGSEPRLQMVQIYRDGKTYLCENGKITDIYVEEIGGISISDIYKKIDEVRPIENESGRSVNRESYLWIKSILESCDVEIKENKTEVRLSDGTRREYTFGNEVDMWETRYIQSENRWFMDGDIFVVDLNECIVDGKTKEIARELETAVKHGCGKVIIDVRGNGGGTSYAVETLLEAMGMEYPTFGSLIRYSPEVKKVMEENGYEGYRDRGISKSYGDIYAAKQNEAVQLIVLSDRHTFSAATMLCTYVKDGKLGKIVGEPSFNQPNAYGDFINVTLEDSKIEMYVSYKQLIRPDDANTDNMLIPDVEVYAEDAYEKAVEMLS